MRAATYDIVTIGGGLAGSALARAMADQGAQVLVLERETQFRDRVRGENVAPWGVAEARRLGLDATLQKANVNQARWVIGLGPDRDLVSSTPQGLPSLTFHHPTMQEALIADAAQSGAHIRRGVNVKFVTPGAPAAVAFDSGGATETVAARLVVGADGRSSNVRKWGKFAERRDPDRLTIAGVLLEGGEGYRSDAAYFMVNPMIGQGSFVAPQSDGRFRAYVAHRTHADLRLHGRDSLPRFVEGCIQCGVPPNFFTGADAVGPLASFSGADSWIDHPYAAGVTLIGDAAACSDPSWGQGLSLTLRDVRVLRDALLADSDWDRAGHAYAREHDRYYHSVHTSEDWLTTLFYDRGELADARRAKALPRIMEDPTRVPDHLFSGPELPIDDAVRRRFFGEE
ncbi:MAG TPA: NAD(P)/FAD-dependent oxidoreductase [Candidatus Binataceae bacterium]|nr:NAD(P)/FAD-dependent oxidoreductase [Candidatus Binataceae bacterium]